MSGKKQGFTLIEMLVVISIIGILMALILPAIQGARAAARALQCKSRMGNVAKALLTFSTAKGGLPARGRCSPTNERTPRPPRTG